MSPEPKVLNITSVKIYPFVTRDTGGRTVAYAEIIIAGTLLIRGIRILESARRGLFIGFPSQRVRRDTFIDIIEPLDRAAGREIREAVIGEYKRVTGWEPQRREEGREEEGRKA
jgi:DNA-binding cell septation regulator SpoVG